MGALGRVRRPGVAAGSDAPRRDDTLLPEGMGCVERTTQSHGCFAIDGLQRPVVVEGQQERHYASREFSFSRGPPLDPGEAMLTPAERASYDQDGYVVCHQPLLSQGEVAHHAALWEACLREELGSGGGSGGGEYFATGGDMDPLRGDAVNGYFKKYGGCFDLVSHPRVVQLAR
eukprot:COSAG05_NODE_500_length_9234_cov_107.281664_1_plen_173_part_10